MAEDGDIKKVIQDQVTSKNYTFHSITFTTSNLTSDEKSVQPILNYLNETPEVYSKLERTGTRLTTGFQNSMKKMGVDFTINTIGSMYTLFFTNSPVTDFPSAKKSDQNLFGKYFHAMLNRGIYMGPSQFESMFLSTALTDPLIDKIINANEESLKEILQA